MTAELFALLFDLTGSTASLEPGPCGGFGVLVDGDVIGSGATESEALEDAIATARGWQSGVAQIQHWAALERAKPMSRGEQRAAFDREIREQQAMARPWGGSK